MVKANYKRHPFLEIVKGALRIFHTRYTVEGKENVSKDQPVVFICNHLKLLGPTVVLLYFPFKYRPWVIHNITNLKTCISYLENDFIYNKLRIKKKPFSRIAAFILAIFCTWLMHSSDAIPTYRDNYKAKLTFEETRECILRGQNILIFPEKTGIPYSEHLNEFYTGFAHLGKKIYMDTGIELKFHPVFIDKINKKVFIIKAEKFNGSNNYNKEKERIVITIMNIINDLAVEAHKKSYTKNFEDI